MFETKFDEVFLEGMTKPSMNTMQKVAWESETFLSRGLMFNSVLFDNKYLTNKLQLRLDGLVLDRPTNTPERFLSS